MKRIWFLIVLVMITGSMAAGVNAVVGLSHAKVQQELSDQVIRFHVRANSDSSEDQQLKFKVRDKIIKSANRWLSQVNDIEDARRILERHLPEMESMAEAVLDEETCPYENVDATLEVAYFPEKTYGAFTFPKGNYEAVVIRLGEGKGENWWCMLYPGLCFVEESYAIVSHETGQKMKEELSEETFTWMVAPETRKVAFRWQFLNEFLEFPI